MNLTGQSLGRYHILEPLGEGGMATVYKAFDTRLEREVAVKVIRREAFPPNQLERILARFEREAKSLARLNHPNIVKVHDFGDHDGAPYLVMEYLPGGTLKQRLDEPMHWQQAAKILLPVARGLAYAHQRGIVHRDVKPSNILITESGDPLLTDFGIAKLLEGEDGQTLTGTGVGIGTPEYMAPEQGMGKEVDGRADLYALGIVFYELLTGRKPYTADTPMAVVLKHVTDPLPRPSQFAPGLPDAVEKLILKALAKQPEDRHASMAEFVAALETLLEARPGPEMEKAKPAVPVPPPADPQATRDDLAATPPEYNQPTRDETPAPAYTPKSVLAPASRRIPAWGWGAGGLVLLAFCALAVAGVYNLDAASLAPTETPSLTVTAIATSQPTDKPISSVGSVDNPIKILFVPSVNTEIIRKGGEEMVKALHLSTGLNFKVVIPNSYAATIQEICASPENTMAFIPGLGYAIASQTCGADIAFKAIRFGYPVYWGQYIVARNSKYQTLHDLEGATWGYPDPGSTTGYMIPATELADLGITTGKQIQYGGHNQTVTAVYNGEVDFGTVFYSVPLTPEGNPVFTWDDYKAGNVTVDMYEIPANETRNCAPNADGKSLLCNGWRVMDARANIRSSAPDVIQKVRILTVTNAIPNDTLCFGADFPINTRAQIEDAMIDFASTEIWWQSIGNADFYGWTGIEPANDAEYDIIRRMVVVTGYTIKP